MATCSAGAVAGLVAALAEADVLGWADVPIDLDAVRTLPKSKYAPATKP